MVCKRMLLATVLPSIILPLLLANLMILPILAARRIRKRRENANIEAHQQQLADNDKLAALASGNTVIQITLPGGAMSTSVLNKGQSTAVPEGASSEVIASAKPGRKTVVKRKHHPGGGAAGGAAAGGVEVMEEQVIDNGATLVIAGEEEVETIIVEEDA